MSDDPNDPQQQQAALAELQALRERNEVVETGRGAYGTATFDEASQVVGDALRERIPEFMNVVRQFDKPHDVIVHLANNEQRLKDIAKLPTARMITEVGRIEAQLSPHGHMSTGADPAWKLPSTKSGRCSEEDWKKNFGSNLSDSQFSREFDRRLRERAERGR